MTWRTARTSTAYCSTDRQFRSVWTTTFATLRWTKSSPGSSPTISLAGTRLSEHPIQRYCGACWEARLWKKSGRRAVISAAQRRLFSNRCGNVDDTVADNRRNLRSEMSDSGLARPKRALHDRRTFRDVRRTGTTRSVDLRTTEQALATVTTHFEPVGIAVHPAARTRVVRASAPTAVQGCVRQ